VNGFTQNIAISPKYYQFYHTSTIHNLSCQATNPSTVTPQKQSPWNQLKDQWRKSVTDMKTNPWPYISIPIIAAFVGYITNWLGVYMLFYPIEWKGIPFRRWPNLPFGLIGWQGVVPAKRFQMAKRMVDVTINRLISVSEIFQKLDPKIIGKILTGSLQKSVFSGLIPFSVLEIYMNKISTSFIQNIENIVDIPSIVLQGMTKNPRTLGEFFQRVGDKELSFLITSGTYSGFLLGVVQMLQWMIYPKGWTLPVGGAVVGYITNWLALKYIFEPLNPIQFGPWQIQGLFLKRQQEVSKAFCTYITTNVLNSYEVWKYIFQTKQSQLQLMEIIKTSTNSILSATAIQNLLKSLQEQLMGNAKHPLHVYINQRLNLKAILISRMNKLSCQEFEQVLHPIFQEDEWILIVAGSILGMIAGGIQWWVNDWMEAKAKASKKEKEMKSNEKDFLVENNSLILQINENEQKTTSSFNSYTLKEIPEIDVPPTPSENIVIRQSKKEIIEDSLELSITQMKDISNQLSSSIITKNEIDSNQQFGDGRSIENGISSDVSITKNQIQLGD
jgi:uncharacterized membrane protein YheB (UPF0754 family)